MPRPDFALLCKAATEEGNLFNVLGAGITSVGVPQLPFLFPVTLVARIIWERADQGQQHVLSVRVEHPDGERLVSLDFPVLPPQLPDHFPDEARAQRILLALPLDIRRPGDYVVRVIVDGDVVQELPLNVTSQLPPV